MLYVTGCHVVCDWLSCCVHVCVCMCVCVCVCVGIMLYVWVVMWQVCECDWLSCCRCMNMSIRQWMQVVVLS